jgi:hypothetical protein
MAWHLDHQQRQTLYIWEYYELTGGSSVKRAECESRLPKSLQGITLPADLWVNLETLNVSLLNITPGYFDNL